MRLVLLLVLTLTLAPEAAHAARWEQRTVRVYDYTPAAWQPVVADAVARYNGLLPRRAPRLIYVVATGPCRRHKQAIAVCVVPRGQIPNPQALADTPSVANGHGALRWAMIRLRDDQTPGLVLIGHELFHAMGVIPHGPWADVRPIPYDDAIMRDLYGRKRRR